MSHHLGHVTGEADWLFQHSSRFKEHSPDVMFFLCYILPVYTLDVIHIMKCTRLSLLFGVGTWEQC